MVRFTKDVASQLITFVKRIEVKGNYWDPTSVSAWEFARQMGSPNLLKFNPKLVVELERTDTFNQSCLMVEFTDGTIWKTDTGAINAADLRNELYTRAEDCEDALEDLEGGKYQLIT